MGGAGRRRPGPLCTRDNLRLGAPGTGVTSAWPCVLLHQSETRLHSNCMSLGTDQPAGHRTQPRSRALGTPVKHGFPL